MASVSQSQFFENSDGNDNFPRNYDSMSDINLNRKSVVI